MYIVKFSRVREDKEKAFLSLFPTQIPFPRDNG